MSLRVVVASRFQDKLSKTESNPDHKWKDIIASFAAAQGISEHGLSFWVGDCKVVPENLVSREFLLGWGSWFCVRFSADRVAGALERTGWLFAQALRTCV